MPMTFPPPQGAELERELTDIRRSVTSSISRTSRRRKVFRVVGVSAILSLGAVTSIGAGLTYSPTIIAPGGIDPLYLEDMATCMTKSGWEPIRGVEDPSGTYSRDEFFQFAVYPLLNEKFADDWEACMTDVERSNGVPSIMMR